MTKECFFGVVQDLIFHSHPPKATANPAAYKNITLKPASSAKASPSTATAPPLVAFQQPPAADFTPALPPKAASTAPPLPPVACDIFISFCHKEAAEEAKALAYALRQHRRSVFLCAEPDADMAPTVASALSQAKLAVILGTESYGEETTAGFNSHQQLRYIIEHKKAFMLIKMCDCFTQQQTRSWLPDTVPHYRWQPKSEAERRRPPVLMVEKVMSSLAWQSLIIRYRR